MFGKYCQQNYDSSEEEESVELNHEEQMYPIKSIHNKIPTKEASDNVDDIEDEDFQLAPKLKLNQQPTKLMPNHSTVSTKTISQSNLHKRPITSAYTFKLKAPSMKKKKQDPVSLFQQASKVWKQDKFLTNRANNKEGRKLNLDKRNKAVNKT